MRNSFQIYGEGRVVYARVFGVLTLEELAAINQTMLGYVGEGQDTGKSGGLNKNAPRVIGAFWYHVGTN